jgi:hypothetical protein
MHGIEHRIRERRAPRCSTPRRLVSPTCGLTSHSTPQPSIFSPERNRLLATTFHSPATAAPFNASIPGSMFPACCFVRLPSVSTARSVPWLRCLARFAPGWASFHAENPLPLSLPASGLPSQLPLPFGSFTSLRIKAFRWFAARRLAFRIRPISSRSPLPVSISLALSNGSSFLVRYVSGGLLFLKPLGTFPNMRPGRDFVNFFFVRFSSFPQKISLVFPNV